jgi:hypothetical protein
MLFLTFPGWRSAGIGRNYVLTVNMVSIWARLCALCPGVNLKSVGAANQCFIMVATTVCFMKAQETPPWSGKDGGVRALNFCPTARTEAGKQLSAVSVTWEVVPISLSVQCRMPTKTIESTASIANWRFYMIIRAYKLNGGAPFQCRGFTTICPRNHNREWCVAWLSS